MRNGFFWNLCVPNYNERDDCLEHLHFSQRRYRQETTIPKEHRRADYRWDVAHFYLAPNFSRGRHWAKGINAIVVCTENFIRID